MIEGEPKPKQIVSFDEAKRMLLSFIKTGGINQLRKIFEDYEIPSEIKNDPDIQWEVGVWKKFLDAANSPDSFTKHPEPIVETLAFLDIKFGKE